MAWPEPTNPGHQARGSPAWSLHLFCGCCSIQDTVHCVCFCMLVRQRVCIYCDCVRLIFFRLSVCLRLLVHVFVACCEMSLGSLVVCVGLEIWSLVERRCRSDGIVSWVGTIAHGIGAIL